MRSGILLAPALFLLACATVEERPDGPAVEELNIHGTDQVKEGAIKKKILTTDKPWWAFWQTTPRYEANAWQADLHRIERFYQAQGYYDAKVLHDEVKPAGPNTVALSVDVVEGPPTKVASIDIEGLDGLPADQRRIALADLPFKVGDVFREDDWVGVKQLIHSALSDLGYVQAEVTGDTFVDVGKHEAHVKVNVSPGVRFKFGNIFVATDPNPQVRAARIIEQAQGAISKGAWYSDSALAEAQSRVFQMGVFGAVKVNRGAPNPTDGTVPIVVDVREAPFHTVKAGGGLGFDATRNEFRVVGEYSDRNFFGGLRRLTIRGRAGYAFLPSVYAFVTQDPKAQAPTPFGESTVELEQPRFLFRDLRLQGRMELERGVEPAFRFYGGRFRIGTIWQPHPAFSVFPSYNLEAYRFDEGEASLQGRSPELAYSCKNPCVLSFLEQTVQWDRRNDKQDPRHGFYFAFSVQEGGGPLGGQFTYLRFQPDARFYTSFLEDDRFTIAARLRVGTLMPLSGRDSDSPIVARFFSGGPGMRGFNNRRLSPMVATVLPGRTSADPPVIQTEPIGGNGLVEGSLELRYSLTRDLVLALFYDLGAVTTYSLELATGSFVQNLHHAVGFGLRYRTIVGPIRVDFARRLNIGPPLTVYQPAGQTVAIPSYSGCFGINETHDPTIAGAPESPCTFHVSIGEAF